MDGKIKEFIEKYTQKHGISKEEALKHKIVQEYIAYLRSVEKDNEMYQV